jgi:hypothetical protein
MLIPASPTNLKNTAADFSPKKMFPSGCNRAQQQNSVNSGGVRGAVNFDQSKP